jgi:hypothetical protein
MNFHMSDIAKVETIELKNLTPDYVALAAKAFLGAAPFVGSLLGEIAGTVIPNQRLERIVKFAKILEEKLASLEKETIKAKLTNENFTDLMEEGLKQAAISLTDERRKYIASVIKNGLNPDGIEFVESKHLLKILGEINDIEVIWLRYYIVPTIGGDTEYRNKHAAVLDRVPVCISSSKTQLDKSEFEKQLDKSTLQESYKKHLVQLGLLENRYETDTRTRQPKFDSSTGGLKTQGYHITGLGKLLLKQIEAVGDE